MEGGQEKNGALPYYIPTPTNNWSPSQSWQFATFPTWASHGLTTPVQLFDPSTGKALPIPMLLSLYNLPAHHFIYAQQVINFVASLCTHFRTSLLDTLLSHNRFKITDVYKPLSFQITIPHHQDLTPHGTKTSPT